jgi:RNA polymerase sigma factor (TIGR02999 family)
VSEVTQLLSAWRDGDEEALERLLPLVYDELLGLARRHMRGEREGHTLQATALVHEAYVRLIDLELPLEDRAHLLAVASMTMRRVLIDHARGKRRHKRDGGMRVTLSPAHRVAAPVEVGVLDLDEGLRELAENDERKAKALELQYFGGLTNPEIAEVLDVSVATVERDLRFARAWLRRRLEGGERTA